jgi:Glycosyl hydrolases family 16
LPRQKKRAPAHAKRRPAHARTTPPKARRSPAKSRVSPLVAAVGVFAATTGVVAGASSSGVDGGGATAVSADAADGMRFAGPSLPSLFRSHATHHSVSSTTTSTTVPMTTTTQTPPTTTLAPRTTTTLRAPTPTPTTTPTTTPPKAAAIPGPSGAGPLVPASLGAPTNLIFDDEFSSGSLNTSVWSPTWFVDGSTQNGTVMDASNVSVDANGLELTLNANNTGAIVSSNPSDGRSGHTGFQVAPSPGKPVYVEYKATLPSAGGQIANWPGLWLTGQNWPQTGEIDVMEGFGTSQFHIEYGPSGSTFGSSGFSNPGGVGGVTPGTHTYGVLWTTTGVTFVYDGVVVGTEPVPLSGPMYLVMENSLGSPSVPGATVTVRDVRVWQ